MSAELYAMYISKISLEISIVSYLYGVCTLKIVFHLVKWLQLKNYLINYEFSSSDKNLWS